MMKQVRIPKHLLNTSQPLPWDVFDANGILLAGKGTILDQIKLALGLPDLYYAPNKTASEDFYNIALKTYPLKLSSLIAGMPENFELMCDGVFKEINSDTSEHIDSLISRLSQLLAGYEASKEWSYKVVRFSQSLYYVLKQNSALFQAILFTRRYFSAQKYSASQALNRAFICYRCCVVEGASDADAISLICAAITCDVSINKKVEEFSRQKENLSLDQKKSLEGHAERSYLMLKAAGVIDTAWLFWVRKHHKKLFIQNSKNKLHLFNDILQVSDILSARCSLRAGRDPLPLFNAMANVAFDETKKLSEIGSILIKALGAMPIGSIIEAPQGISVLISPDAIVPLTNENLDTRSHFRIESYEISSISEFRPKNPLLYRRLSVAINLALNQLGEYVSYSRQYERQASTD